MSKFSHKSGPGQRARLILRRVWNDGEELRGPKFGLQPATPLSTDAGADYNGVPKPAMPVTAAAAHVDLSRRSAGD